MARVITIHVGAPEDDRKVSVSTEQTVSEVLTAEKVALAGTIQHNGRVLSSAKLGKTLEELGFVENDSIHVVRKMDGARG